MSDFYVPWPQRREKRFGGVQGAIAGAAVALYRAAAPIVRRFPGPLFLGAVLGSCLLAWSVALLFQAAWTVAAHVRAAGVAESGAALSISQVQQGLREIGSSAPALAVWLVQRIVVRDVIALVGVIGFVSVLAMFAIWWERKVAGHIQSRFGPMRVGGWHGWSQSLADGLKLIAKEDLIPQKADRPLFRLAPYLSFVPAVCAFIALPFGTYWVFRNLDVGLLFILAMLGVEVLGTLIAGWASNNKWSVFGALREGAQVVAYEIPMGFSLLVPVMVAGSLQLTGPGSVVEAQQGGWFHWLAWHSPWTFLATFTYFIASLAACKRAPFDLPEAESELVAGFHTEYSGFRWSLFFFAEYAAMFVVSAILVLLFLGGWDAPWAGAERVLGDFVGSTWLADLGRSAAAFDQILYGVLFSGPIWFVAKCMFLVYVQMWLRWTLPRLRIDQVLYSCIQVILPLTMVVLLASVVWELAIPRSPAFARLAGLVSVLLALIGAAGAAAIVYIAAYGIRNRSVMVGTMAVESPLRAG